MAFLDAFLCFSACSSAEKSSSHGGNLSFAASISKLTTKFILMLEANRSFPYLFNLFSIFFMLPWWL